MRAKSGDLATQVGLLAARSRREGECLMVPQVRYGIVRYDGGLMMSAHRAAYTVANGPIPEGMIVRHSCDRMGCIEPSHLLVGTHLDNSRDMIERGRTVVGEAHPAATHSAEQVAAAVAEYLQGGQSQAAVARKHGMSQSALGHWVRADFRKDAGQVPFRQGKGNHAHNRGGLKPCGTRAGYARHHVNKEPPCDPCLEANRAYMRAWKDSRNATRLKAAAA